MGDDDADAVGSVPTAHPNAADDSAVAVPAARKAPHPHPPPPRTPHPPPSSRTKLPPPPTFDPNSVVVGRKGGGGGGAAAAAGGASSSSAPPASFSLPEESTPGVAALIAPPGSPVRPSASSSVVAGASIPVPAPDDDEGGGGGADDDGGGGRRGGRKKKLKKKPAVVVHSTTEAIPPLESAPNSGSASAILSSVQTARARKSTAEAAEFFESGGEVGGGAGIGGAGSVPVVDDDEEAFAAAPPVVPAAAGSGGGGKRPPPPLAPRGGGGFDAVGVGAGAAGTTATLPPAAPPPSTARPSEDDDANPPFDRPHVVALPPAPAPPPAAAPAPISVTPTVARVPPPPPPLPAPPFRPMAATGGGGGGGGPPAPPVPPEAPKPVRIVGAGRRIPPELKAKVDAENASKQRQQQQGRRRGGGAGLVDSLPSSVGESLPPSGIRDVPAPPAFASVTVPSGRTAAAIQEKFRRKKKKKKKQQRRRSAAKPPTLTPLASRQTRIPILVVPTLNSRALASKNRLTLPAMFNALGDSVAPPRSGQSSAVAPRLPPFRSASRSMVLNWNDVRLSFVDGIDCGKIIDPNDADDRLRYASDVTDDDADFDEGMTTSAFADGDALEGRVSALLDDELRIEEREAGGGTAGGPDRSESNRDPMHHGSHRGNVGDKGEEALHEESFNESERSSERDATESALSLTSRSDTPWLLRFRDALDDVTSNLPHEMTNCPPLCLLVSSTSDDRPIDCLAELANVHHLPSPFQDGRFDPNGMRREFVLLHDETDGPEGFDENYCLREMQRRFGVGCCAVLRINSLGPPDEKKVERGEVREDAVWEGYLGPGGGDGGGGENLPAPGPSEEEEEEEVVADDFDEEEGYDDSDENDDDEEDRGGPVVVRGACLSTNDKIVIRRYVATLVANGILPALERRISSLNAAVNNAKKGVKNVLKSFWRTTKPKDGGGGAGNGGDGSNHPSSQNNVGGGGYGFGGGGNVEKNVVGDYSNPNGGAVEVKYRYDSIESQIRLLADTLFLMRDYDAALGMYKLVKDDYKHDRSLLHYASVHEMMGLCLYQMDPYGTRHTRDLFGNLETALYSYTRAAEEERSRRDSGGGSGANGAGGGARPDSAPHPTRLATRLCLVLSSTSAMSSARHMEVADLLASASSHETPLGAAVLLEQSASHYYRAGMYRKYAFHMLMSGHMYRGARSEDHAFRCFTAALYVYHGGRWDELRNHLRSALAAQLYGVGRMTVSMQLYAKLVGTRGGGRVSVRSQQKFVNHLLEICRSHATEAMRGADRMAAVAAEEKGEGVFPGAGGGGRGGGGVVATTGSVEEVLRTTPTAVRVLEVPRMDLPRIDDSTVSVRVEGQDEKGPGSGGGGSGAVRRLESVDESTVEVGADGGAYVSTTGGGGTSRTTFGTPKAGSESVWTDLMCAVQAELRVADRGADSAAAAERRASDSPSDVDDAADGDAGGDDRKEVDDDDDDPIEQVVQEIDKEKSDLAYAAKVKSRGYHPTRTARARREPLSIAFSIANPLGVPVRLSDAQLVARLRGSDGRVCTNEGAVSIGSEREEREREEEGAEGGGGVGVVAGEKQWRFNSSEGTFFAGEFTRLSPKPSPPPPPSSSSSGAGAAAVPSPPSSSTGLVPERPPRPPPPEPFKRPPDVEPYFVVTKADLSMEANTREDVTLRICPLVSGELDVLGVRCKLFDEVWVYHEFKVKGPLLQDTRLNRANRVRGESYLLKSKIEHDMPSLAVDILPDHVDGRGGRKRSPGGGGGSSGAGIGGGATLQGQIGAWTLRVSNLGTAPAAGVTLKTNVPWISIADSHGGRRGGSGDGDGWEDRATSRCVGPSGTLMRLPLGNDGDGGGGGTKGGIIRPGETMEVPVHVRTSGGGRQELYMLFRYELLDERRAGTLSAPASSAPNGMPKHRWLRKMLSVPVYPSLTLAATLMPSYWKKREHVLSIEMTNYRSDGSTNLELNLEKISVASRFYRVTQLWGQLGELDPLSSEAHQQELHGGPKTALQIGWQEQVTMHYLIQPLEKEDIGYRLSECRLMGGNEGRAEQKLEGPRADNDGFGTAVTDFVCLEHAHERFKLARKAHNEELARLALLEEEEGRHPRSVAQIRRAKSSMDAPSKDTERDDSAPRNGGEDTRSEEHAGSRASDSQPPSNEGGGSPNYHPTSISSLCPPREGTSKIHVICSWTAAGSSTNGGREELIHGQHHLRQLAVRPQMKSKGCPLTITAKHKSEVSHDFGSGPLDLDLEITVRNRLVESTVEFEFAVERQQEFEFVGAESFKWMLNGGEELTVPLRVVFSTSGVYNLQSVRLTVVTGGVRVPYLFPLQWIVRVNANA